ncbi:unnamed protein product [Ectocarpus sp. CCAP 1310/34]|nr:unnamed protein product [Ectocarpus sp. CCAP 1310/34]
MHNRLHGGRIHLLLTQDEKHLPFCATQLEIATHDRARQPEGVSKLETWGALLYQ